MFTKKESDGVIAELAREHYQKHLEVMEAFIKPLVDAGATPDSFELVQQDKWEGTQLTTVYYLRRRQPEKNNGIPSQPN